VNVTEKGKKRQVENVSMRVNEERQNKTFPKNDIHEIVTPSVVGVLNIFTP
jgi:hypothetical protein